MKNDEENQKKNPIEVFKIVLSQLIERERSADAEWFARRLEHLDAEMRDEFEEVASFGEEYDFTELELQRETGAVPQVVPEKFRAWMTKNVEQCYEQKREQLAPIATREEILATLVELVQFAFEARYLNYRELRPADYWKKLAEALRALRDVASNREHAILRAIEKVTKVQ